MVEQEDVWSAYRESGKRQADVVVVGAGPAGSTVAALLAERGWKVALLDRALFPRDKTCGDGLTPRAVKVLKNLGVLPDLLATRCQQVDGARLYAPSSAMLQASFADFDLGLPPFGLVVPRFALDDRLRQHAMQQGARFYAGATATAPLWEDGQVGGVQVALGEQSVPIRARLTILATGASLPLLRSFGVLEQMPPGINAIRGYFTGVPDISPVFEFFFDRELAPGYGWLFPLADGRVNIGLGIDTSRQMGQSWNTRRLLTDFLARHERLQEAQSVEPVKGYPIRTDYPCHSAIGPGYMLVGETLGLVNPVTGEGIDLALESAEMAARVADRVLQDGPATRKKLLPYDRALRRRYAATFRGLRWLKALAMHPVGLSRLIEKAGDRPYLARTILGINLSVLSPAAAAHPRIWWEILT